MPNRNNGGLPAGMLKLILLGVVGLVALVFVGCAADNMWYRQNANEIVVKQDAISGKLHVSFDPGTHMLNWGTVTRYTRSAQLNFSEKKDAEGKLVSDTSIKVRFNDGGHGNINGSLRYTLPLDEQKMTDLHRTYHSMEAIDADLVGQVVKNGVYMSGPLMSSRESFSERRNDLISYITDQIENGVYRTEHEQVKQVDPITNQEKTTDIVRPKLVAGAPGGIEREEASPIQKFGMSVNNISIGGITYDQVVEQQIQKQQDAWSQMQQAIMNSKKAEQDALTVEQQGKAEAAKAKWAQEVEKATAVTSAEKEKAVAVTQAQKEKEVAELNLQTAKLAAQQTITEAKADSDAKRLQVVANNNLNERLDAYVKVQQAWAESYSKQRQVPDVLMSGGGNGSTANPMNAAMEALSVKAMRDLRVNPNP